MSDPRSLLRESWELLDGDAREELLAFAMETWKATLAASKDTTVEGVFECRGCHKRTVVKVPVPVPDILTRARAFSELANQVYGKPPETRIHEVDIGERTLEALQGMSMLELARAANAEVVDGELVELPSLPSGS